MVRLEDMFQRFPRTPMSVEVKVENDKLIQEVILQAGWGAGAGGQAPRHLFFPLLPDSQPGEALWPQ